LGHAIAIMPARIEKNKNFMNVTNRALQCCAVAKKYGRKNAKLAWTTPFVPDTFNFPESRIDSARCVRVDARFYAMLWARCRWHRLELILLLLFSIHLTFIHHNPPIQMRGGQKMVPPTLFRNNCTEKWEKWCHPPC
jgi:hypothetical protein